jgi:carbamoyl-phosphate synthase small subunit
MTAIHGERSRPGALLVLEDGRTFEGQAYGHVGEVFGEAVFNTGMTGYQEILTDPSYHRQVVVMTAPHIGNTGVNDEDDESERIRVAGYVVRDPVSTPSNWRSTGTLEDRLQAERVVGMCGVDTRALTRHLRTRGAMRVGVSSTGAGRTQLLERVRRQPSMARADLTGEVSTTQPYTVAAGGPARFTVAAVDFGIKRGILRRLSARGVTTHVLPASCTAQAIAASGADAVLLSNGPGDPGTADRAVELTRELLQRGVPLFGICFGHQVLGRALGFSTYKLAFGHRGINQPVLDRASGRVEVTAHNHGFAVDAAPDHREATAFGEVEVSHVCLNDRVVEGLRCLDAPAFSVQYHPEAAAGPRDADHLFDGFTALLEEHHA